MDAFTAVTGDSATYMRAYEKLGGAIQVAPLPRAAEDAVSGLAECAVLVDAMLGTGTKGEVVGAFRKAIADRLYRKDPDDDQELNYPLNEDDKG